MQTYKLAARIGDAQDLHLAKLPFPPGEEVEVIVRSPVPTRPDYPYRPNHGRFPSEEKALEAIVRRLVDALKPFRIYLFGSRAESRARPDSDFDLVVVFDDQAPPIDYEEVYAPLLDLDIGCDVIPCRWSEFQEVLNDSTNPWQPSWASARKVYERPA